jgi:hypothetical protein
MVVVRLKVVKIDAHDDMVGVKVGDVYDAYLAFNSNGGNHYYIIKAPNGKDHHLLPAQVEGIDRNSL